MQKRPVPLVATALESTWPEARELLFLGQWCLRQSRRHVWEDRIGGIVSYHWDDRDLLKHDLKRLRAVHEDMLLRLASALNEAHGTRHSLRYWRIVAGRWLLSFIATYYDRYTCLKRAQAAEPSLRMITHTPTGPSSIFAQSNSELPVFDDGWNETLFSYIALRFTDIAAELVPPSSTRNHVQDSRGRKGIESHEMNQSGGATHPGADASLEEPLMVSPPAKGHPARRRLRHGLKWRYKLAKRSISHAWSNEAVLALSDCWPAGGLSGALLLRQSLLVDEMYVRSTAINCLSIQPSELLRARIAMRLSHESDSAIEGLSQAIADFLPLPFLEGYAYMRKASQEIGFPTQPKVIATASAGFGTNDAFRVYAAECVERHATKLVACQHGGVYGTHVSYLMGDHDLDIVDRFLTWGWLRSGEPRLRRAPSYFLVRDRQVLPKRRPRLEAADGQSAGYGASPNRLLLVSSSNSRYASSPSATKPIGPQWHRYHLEQLDFARRLDNPPRKALVVRPNKDFGWDLEDYWREERPVVNIDTRGNKLRLAMTAARLSVISYNGTSLLQALDAKVPFVAFWSRSLWELSPQSSYFFDVLRSAGLLFDHPHECAELVNGVWDNVLGWWQTPAVQLATAEFAREFCHVGRFPKIRIARAIRRP